MNKSLTQRGGVHSPIIDEFFHGGVGINHE
jgi:hypothetical protein